MSESSHARPLAADDPLTQQLATAVTGLRVTAYSAAAPQISPRALKAAS